MQRVFFIVLITLTSILMLSIILNLNVGTEKEPKSIKVSLIYRNETVVYEIEPYSTVNDLLELAGNNFDFDENKVNRNQILGHRDVINLPEKTIDKCISINTGTKEELMTLKGIGEKAAIEIIEFRLNNGNFVSLDDLTLVKGIGVSKLSLIKDNLCL